MSEQHSERFEEELDSAHSRLDSILDQLSALGTTDGPALAETPGPGHPAPLLRSVPDLDPLMPPALPDLMPISTTVEDLTPPSEESTEVQAEESDHLSAEEPELEQANEPLVVEYHELEITSPPETEDVVPELSVVEPTAVVDDEAKATVGGDEELVFMLDGPLRTEQPTDTAAEAKASPLTEPEFTQPEFTEAEFAEPQFGAPEITASEISDDVDAGWVSHHEANQVLETELVAPTVEDVEQPVAVAPSFDSPQWAEEPTDVDAEVGSVDIFGHGEPEADETLVSGEPEFFDVEGASGLSELSMELQADGHEDTPDHAEPILEALSSDVLGTDFTSAAPVSTEDEEPTGYESLFETDEELPLPDFTGVWADEDLPESVWDQAQGFQSVSVPDPVESGQHRWGIAVGRNELDSLRPVEDEVVTAEQAGVARKLQLVMVVLFGLIALAVILLEDPAVVDDLRELYDGFFG